MADEEKKDLPEVDEESTEESTEEESTSKGKGKGKGKKRALLKYTLIGVLGIVFVGLGVGATLFFLKEQTPEELLEAKKAEKVAKKKKALPTEGHYFEFHQPFTISFGKNQKKIRYMQVNMAILTRIPETRTLLKEHEPLIVNEVEMALGEKTFSQVNSLAGKEKLRQELREVIEETLKTLDSTARIEEVFYTIFVMN